MKKTIMTMLLVGVMIMGMSITCFASSLASSLVKPTLDETQYNAYIIMVYTQDNVQRKDCVLYHTDSYDVIYYKDNNSIQFTSKVESPRVRYLSTNYDSAAENPWGTFSQFDYSGIWLAENTSVYSNYDIPNSDGGFFFLSKTVVEKIMETELPQMITKLDGEITILVLCGVGCLALLILLPMLVKILQIFRV